MEHENSDDMSFVLDIVYEIIDCQKDSRDCEEDAPSEIKNRAQEGDARYQCALGAYFNHECSESSEHNADKSYYWLDKAIKQGFKPAERFMQDGLLNGFVPISDSYEEIANEPQRWHTAEQMANHLEKYMALHGKTIEEEEEIEELRTIGDILNELEKLPETEENAINELKYYMMWRNNGGGDCITVLRLAKYYRMGLGVPQDDTIATELYKEGINITRHPVAAAEVYRSYRDGIGVAANQDKAQKYFQRAVFMTKQWGCGISELGAAYRTGEFVVADDKEAAFWYREAKKQG